MKRTLARMILFLLIGAIINVAVAWGCAYFLGSLYVDWFGSIPESTTASWQRDLTMSGIGKGMSEIHVSRWLLYPVPSHEWERVLDPQEPDYMLAREKKSDDMYERSVHLCGRGWPFISHVAIYFDAQTLSYRTELFSYPNGPLVTFEPIEGWKLPKWLLTYQPNSFECIGLNALPLRPLWPGFLLNTAFYTALLTLLIHGPGRIRRKLRCHRGLCLACAYPIGTSHTCTECGTPVTPRSSP